MHVTGFISIDGIKTVLACFPVIYEVGNFGIFVLLKLKKKIDKDMSLQ